MQCRKIISPPINPNSSEEYFAKNQKSRRRVYMFSEQHNIIDVHSFFCKKPCTVPCFCHFFPTAQYIDGDPRVFSFFEATDEDNIYELLI